jgi:uncharacterized lipoprotein
MKRVAALFLPVILLTGCGQKSKPEGMTARFQKLDFAIVNRETIAAPSDPSLARLTRRYAALVREYATVLGRPEAKRRLTQKADELGHFCLPCAATLYDAAKKY